MSLLNTSDVTMNFIYLGSPRPAHVNKELLDMGSYVNFAGNTLQQALLEGFSKPVPHLKIISGWTMTTFPKVRTVFLKRRVFEEFGTKDYVYVGGINLPILNLVSRYFRCRKELKKMLSNDDENIVVIYEVHTPFLLATKALRKRIKHISLIVPDMPQFMSGNQGKLHKILKNIDAKLIKRCLKKVDSYALLSKGMTELLPMENKKWTLMEGIFQNTFTQEQVKKDPHKVIMYTGGIHRRRGTDLLIKAFQLINDSDYRLWIRGDGDDSMKEEIISLSKKDSRIVYFEPMERAELLKMEQQATVMVNPTQPSLDFTNYFFPSKTMEYLASGTPTVMFHLACMPKEYDDYLFYVEEESPESLRDKLVEVCELPYEERQAFGHRASQFILTQKTPEKQCGKILEIIKESL